MLAFVHKHIYIHIHTYILHTSTYIYIHLYTSTYIYIHIHTCSPYSHICVLYVRHMYLYCIRMYTPRIFPFHGHFFQDSVITMIFGLGAALAAFPPVMQACARAQLSDLDLHRRYRDVPTIYCICT